MTSEPLKLPGFGLPVDHEGSDDRFPNAVMDWAGISTTVRERTMVAMMDSITDKPEWDRKVFQEDIILKWRQEAMDSDMDVSEKMLDWTIAELHDKARIYQRDGIIPTLDLDATVVKSDTAMSLRLNQDLRAACKSLEDVPPDFKDWHPGSEERVLDLVHPSLFPHVYGWSKVLPTSRMCLTDCMNYFGKGVTSKMPSDANVSSPPLSDFQDSYGVAHPRFWSKDFQWLPCQVNFAGEEAVEITSYINNLHPVEHSSLYTAIEACIAKSIPLWDRTLSSILSPHERRIEMTETSYSFPEGEEPPRDSVMVAGEIDYEREENWRRSTRVLIQPEPGKYKTADQPTDVDLRKQFHGTGLQVIVKLANIELSPEKPNYAGGAWHIEGQLNERICASALYYYASENITESFLAFRQKVDENLGGMIERKQYEQDDYEGVEEIYGVEQGGAKVQEIGRVSTRQGRLLAFPNVLQHRVSPFRLEDPSKPGHRKILALFLVDPHTPVLSTANVPPQQKDWWSKALADEGSLSMLPQELADQVVGEVKEGVMTLEEAKDIRLKLMEERKAFVDEVEHEMQEYTYSFCEH